MPVGKATSAVAILSSNKQAPEPASPAPAAEASSPRGERERLLERRDALDLGIFQ
jgi:hypothetical protein